MSKQNYDALIERLEKISQKYPQKGLAGGMPTDKEEEEYAIFVDDDTDISTIDYWSFTWDEFVANLPKNWECVQLF